MECPTDQPTHADKERSSMPGTKGDAKKNASAVAEAPPTAAKPAEKTYEGLTRQQLGEMYSLMYLSRRSGTQGNPPKVHQKDDFAISAAPQTDTTPSTTHAHETRVQ